MMLRTAMAALLLVAALAQAQSVGKYYPNDRWGFKVRAPSGWKQAALSANEEWIVTKFTDTRKLYAKKSEFLEGDYPNMWVIGFPHKRQEERGAKVSQDGDETTITFKNPYKGYKDFVKRERWFVGGGYHFAKEEQGTHKGIKVTKYEIAIEKMVAAPYRIVTWVYHFDDIDFAVQFKILQDYYKKYRVAFHNCLKSFRRIDRKRSLPGSATTGDSIVTAESEEKLTPEEKAKRRQEKFERTLRKEVEALPEDWYVKRSKHYVAMANCSKKFTGEVLNHAEAIRAYLDKTFGDVGSDYVPPGIIRIFATSAEEKAFRQSSGTTWFFTSEQVSLSEQDKKEGRKTWAMEWVSDRITSQWISFRNRMLSENMPWWFRWGLEQHMKFARVKGKRVTIKPDEYDREQMKAIIKQNKAVSVRELFEKGDDMATYGMQCGSVVSYLLTDGNRGKYKNLVVDYMTNLITAIEDAEKQFRAKRDDLKDEAEKELEDRGEQGEESEDESGEEDGKEYWEEYSRALKDRRKAIRQMAFDKTFGKLKDKDWDRLDRAWLKHAG